MQRRSFLMTGVAGILGTGLQAEEKEKPKLEIIDTHTHFYDPTRPQGVPWPGKDDKALYRRVMPDDHRDPV